MAKDVPIVIGSVAYDYIFPINGIIRKELPLTDGKLPDNLQLAFTASDSVILRGGTGGNITYGLGVLGTNPMLVSAAGKDFNRYENALRKIGCNISVKRYNERDTAHCYQINDANNEQIILWQANAYDHASEVKLEEVLKDFDYNYPYAIFSPGAPSNTPQHISEFNNLYPSSKVIFDPGQMTMAYSTELFIKTVSMSDLIIINDAELAKIRVNHGLDKKELFELGLEIIVETCGENGSIFHNKDGSLQKIGIAKPLKILDPTGAGDSFRSGLIYGLMKNLSIKDAGKFGAALASFCLENIGGQEYSPSIREIEQRMKKIPEF